MWLDCGQYFNLAGHFVERLCLSDIISSNVSNKWEMKIPQPVEPVLDNNEMQTLPEFDVRSIFYLLILLSKIVILLYIFICFSGLHFKLAILVTYLF